MKQTGVEQLVSELKKYDSAGLKDQSNYVIEMPTHILTELEEQAKEIENQQRGYSDEEVLNFTQTIIQQYKLGNTNIEQLDLLKETLQQFKNKKFPQQEKNEEAQIPDPSDFMKLGEEAFVKNVAENLRAELTPREKILWLQGYLLAVTQYRKK